MTIRHSRRELTANLYQIDLLSRPHRTPRLGLLAYSNNRSEPLRNDANRASALSVLDRAIAFAAPASQFRAIAKNCSVKKNIGARFKRP